MNSEYQPPPPPPPHPDPHNHEPHLVDNLISFSLAWGQKGLHKLPRSHYEDGRSNIIW